MELAEKTEGVWAVRGLEADGAAGCSTVRVVEEKFL
jgi:hypothetical protein